MTTPRPWELTEKIYRLCNDEQYFTCGTSRQYDRMFEMAKDPEFGCEDVAAVIYICSENADFHTVMEQLLNICRDIEEADAMVRMEEWQAAGERAADEVYCGYFD